MKIHALTLNWNAADKIQNLSKSLIDPINKLDKEFIWHVRDNGSKDNSINILKNQKQLNINIYSIGHNRDNFAQGINYLFKQANPSDDDLVLLLNNDIIFNDSNSLKNMFNLMKESDAAIVGARLLYTNTNKLQHAGVIFGMKYNKMPYHFRYQEESDENSKKNRYFQAVTAAVSLIKASKFKEVDGMDINYSWAFEDIDLNLKIGKKNKIAYCGSANIFHEESASLKKNPMNKMFVSKNVNYFKTKWNDKYKLDHEYYLSNSKYNEI